MTETTDIDIWADKLMDRLNGIYANNDMQKFSMMRAHIKEILALYGQNVAHDVCINFTKNMVQHLPETDVDTGEGIIVAGLCP